MWNWKFPFLFGAAAAGIRSWFDEKQSQNINIEASALGRNSFKRDQHFFLSIHWVFPSLQEAYCLHCWMLLFLLPWVNADFRKTDFTFCAPHTWNKLEPDGVRALGRSPLINCEYKAFNLLVWICLFLHFRAHPLVFFSLFCTKMHMLGDVGPVLNWDSGALTFHRLAGLSHGEIRHLWRLEFGCLICPWARIPPRSLTARLSTDCVTDRPPSVADHSGPERYKSKAQ